MNSPHTLYNIELSLRQIMRWLWNGIRDYRGITYGNKYTPTIYGFEKQILLNQIKGPVTVSGLPGPQIRIEGEIIKVKMNIKDLGLKNFLPFGCIDKVAKETEIVPLSVSKILEGEWKNGRVVTAALRCIVKECCRLLEFVLRPEVVEFMKENDPDTFQKYGAMRDAINNME